MLCYSFLAECHICITGQSRLNLNFRQCDCVSAGQFVLNRRSTARNAHAWHGSMIGTVVSSYLFLESKATARLKLLHIAQLISLERLCVRECVRVGVCSVCGVVQLWHCVLALCA